MRVSGHASQEEIKLMHRLVHPKFFMPVHGEYRHLVKHKKLAMQLGMSKDNIVIAENGSVVDLTRDSIGISGKVTAGRVLIDGLGVGDVGNVVLRDRRQLSQDGILIVVVTIDHSTYRIAAGPDIVSRGFVYVRNSESLMDEAKTVLNRTMEYCMDHNITDWGKIKNEVKDALGDFVWKETKRRPMIMPIIMEV